MYIFLVLGSVYYKQRLCQTCSVSQSIFIFTDFFVCLTINFFICLISCLALFDYHWVTLKLGVLVYSRLCEITNNPHVSVAYNHKSLLLMHLTCYSLVGSPPGLLHSGTQVGGGAHAWDGLMCVTGTRAICITTGKLLKLLLG